MKYDTSLDGLLVHADKVLQNLIRWQVAESDQKLAAEFKRKVALVDKAIDLLIKAKAK